MNIPPVVWSGLIVAASNFISEYFGQYEWAPYALVVLLAAGSALNLYLKRQGVAPVTPVAPTDYSGLNPAAAPQYVPQKPFVREWLFG